MAYVVGFGLGWLLAVAVTRWMNRRRCAVCRETVRLAEWEPKAVVCRHCAEQMAKRRVVRRFV